MRIIRILVLLLFVLHLHHTQAIAVSCHCFQDRIFDSQRPSAADEYFLATTQNSLLSAALNVPKKSIVQAKMGGADADLLWVAYYVSDRTGLEISEIIGIYTGAGDWTGFVEKLLKSADKFERPFLKALAQPMDLAALANGAYRSVMTGQLGMDESSIDTLKINNASRKEQILTYFISQLLGEKPTAVFGSVRLGGKSWGEVLSETGIDPKQIESAWRKLIRMHKGGI